MGGTYVTSLPEGEDLGPSDWQYLANKESVELCHFLWDTYMSKGIANNPGSNPFKVGMENGKFVVHVKMLKYEIMKRRPLNAQV